MPHKPLAIWPVLALQLIWEESDESVVTRPLVSGYRLTTLMILLSLTKRKLFPFYFLQLDKTKFNFLFVISVFTVTTMYM
jgi:hypothetical protein